MSASTTEPATPAFPAAKHEQKVTPWEVEGEVDEAGKLKEIDYNVGIQDRLGYLPHQG
jgi:hypothetical protein